MPMLAAQFQSGQINLATAKIKLGRSGSKQASTQNRAAQITAKGR
jgi:hypothetical protein